MTKVKVCGLSERIHVIAAVEAGADAIGFVFAPSSRRISVELAKELVRDIPENVLKIGVFVNETAEEITRIFHEVQLDFVQFHGEESPGFINQIGLPSIKALSVKNAKDVEKSADYQVDYTLFDAPGTVYKGGSGVPFDWKLLTDSGIQADKLILAGGLNVQNVNEAIHRVQPFMVDVSSGVEKEGRKDVRLIQAFINAVKNGER